MIYKQMGKLLLEVGRVYFFYWKNICSETIREDGENHSAKLSLNSSSLTPLRPSPFQLLEYQWGEGRFDTLGLLGSAHRALGMYSL